MGRLKASEQLLIDHMIEQPKYFILKNLIPAFLQPNPVTNIEIQQSRINTIGLSLCQSVVHELSELFKK